MLSPRPDDWSRLSRQREMPEIDVGRMHAYRLSRVREQLRRAGAALGVFVSPVSLRYAVDYRAYALFNAHIPATYLFVAGDGPVVLHGALGEPPPLVDHAAPRGPSPTSRADPRCPRGPTCWPATCRRS